MMDRSFYIGSQNLCPSGLWSPWVVELHEHGFFVDTTPSLNSDLYDEVVHEYVEPTWNSATSDRDGVLPNPYCNCKAKPHLVVLDACASGGDYKRRKSFNIILNFHDVDFNQTARVIKGGTTCDIDGTTVDISIRGVVKTDKTFVGEITSSSAEGYTKTTELTGTLEGAMFDTSFSDLEMRPGMFFSGTVRTAGCIYISTAAGYQGYPASAYNDNANEFMVIWVDGRDPETGYDIYGQVVSANGALIGEEFVVAQDINETSENVVFPRLAYNTKDNQYLAIWQQGDSVHSQLLKSDGKRVGSVTTVVTGTAVTPIDVAYNIIQNEYLVAWVDEREGRKIFGRRISNLGAPNGDAVALTNYTVNSLSIAYNQTNDEYLVTYCPWLGSTVRDEIRAQRVSGADLSMLGEIRVTNDIPGLQWLPDVALNLARRKYLVVWEDARHSLSENYIDIYAQQVAADGTLVGDNFALCTAADHQFTPQVACNAATAKCLVVWGDHRTADISRIYARFLSEYGTPEGDEFVIYEASDGQRHPHLACSYVKPKWLVVWDDDWNDYGDICGSMGVFVRSERE